MGNNVSRVARGGLRRFRQALTALETRAAALEDRVGDQPEAAPPSNTGATDEIMSLYRDATGNDVPDDAPLVTVVVPSYNESRFLGDAVASLKAQTFRNFRAVIVDDASSDDSPAVAVAAINSDARFEFVQHEANSGLSAARNTGLGRAETDFICFLDGDDYFYETNLEERVRYLIGAQVHPEVAGVYSGVEQVQEDASFATGHDVKPSRTPAIVHDHLSAAGACPFNCHAPMLRTDVVRQVGGFDEDMREGAEDWDVWQRIMRNGFTFHPTPSTLAVYRQKPSSMVRAMPSQHLTEADRLSKSVHQDIDPAHVIADPAFVFTEPLGVYQQKQQITERALSFLGLAHLTGDDDQLDDALSVIDPDFWTVARRNLPVSDLLDLGIRRGFAVDPDEFREREAEAKPIRDSLLERLELHARTGRTDT